jgi:hypothetical protein
MVDDPDAKAGADAHHLESCPECQARLKTMSDDARAVATLLAVPDVNVDVTAAFSRVRSAPQARPALGFRLPVTRPGSRPMVLAFAATIAIAALLVTALAQSFKTFVSPNTVTPVPVTVADMQALSQLSDYGTVTWTTQPQMQVATTAAEAATVSGLQPPKVANLPAGVSSTVTYAAMTKAIAVFTFSSDKASAAEAKNGKSLPPLPSGMNGAQLTVTVGPAVGEVYGDLKQAKGSDVSSANLPQLIVGKSVTPSATSTQVSVKQLEDYILSLPGITPELKAAIKAIGDPSVTLPIPVPVQYAKSSKVTVQGVPGVALGDNTGLGSAVVWVKSGFVYAVAGTIKQSDAINIANNLT